MLTNYIKTKGNEYEKYVLNFFKSKIDVKAWLFKNTPEYIIAKTNLYKSYDLYSKYRNCDIGADIVALIDNNVYFIQCKNYENVISIDDLASFYFLLHEFDLNGYVYYNGTLSERINDLSMGKVPFIHLPFNNQIIDNKLLNINNNVIHEPRDYQVEAYNLLQHEHRSILSLPCGMGKTYTSYMIAKTYSNIIIISPTRSLSIDLLNNFSQYSNSSFNPLLISMDGSRDPVNIKSMLKDKNVISVTYDSVDILNMIINDLDNIMIIIDEFHNLSDNNINDKNNEINKILSSTHKILYLSATPFDFNNNEYFGNVIYKYSWKEAINKSYICDFKIILPAEKEYLKIFNKFLNDINVETMSPKLVNKTYFLLRSMLYEGSKKCIIYMTTIDKANNFKIIIEWMQKLLNIKIKTYLIDCYTAKTKRFEYFSSFISDEEISLMINVQILNEGIDIPCCDSVFITSPNNNIINIVQRMCRANRIMDDKKECKIYMWCGQTKIDNVLKYINEKTQDETSNKIFKFSINDDRYGILNKYMMPNENKMKQSNIYVTDFLKKYSNIPSEFIDDFYSCYDSGKSEHDYVFNFDKLAFWLGTKKGHLQTLLSNKFIKDKDYIIQPKNNNGKGIGRGKNNIKTIMLSYDCANLLCMCSKTKKSNKIRQYFIEYIKTMAKFKNIT
jgi:superfamily II DNA or RNA helicase/phage anti-repressor protein